MVELICVIVILGVLSASALPRFVDLRTEAAAEPLDLRATTAATRCKQRLQA